VGELFAGRKIEFKDKIVGSEKSIFIPFDYIAIGFWLKVPDRPPWKEDKRWILANCIMTCAHVQLWPETASVIGHEL
jgi:hypothetical protein